MYYQLTSYQWSQIFALLQRRTPRKVIASIVGCSQSTLNFDCPKNVFFRQIANFALATWLYTQKIEDKNFARFKNCCTFAPQFTPHKGCGQHKKGRLAQLVQSICLTSRGSAVRIRQRPPLQERERAWKKISSSFFSACSHARHRPQQRRSRQKVVKLLKFIEFYWVKTL